VRGALAVAAADDSLARRACTLIFTAIYWRNTWKYQARGYRHLFWDSGTMLANALAVGNALSLSPRLLAGFVDDDVNRLLGLDVSQETALELLAVGPENARTRDASGAAAEIGDAVHAVMPLSQRHVDYPLLREQVSASALSAPDAVRAWRHTRPPAPRALAAPRIALPQPDLARGRGLGETIQRRGSTRRFAHTALELDEFAAALWAASRPIPGDVAGGLVDVYLVINAVDGVAPGSYRYVAEAHALVALAAGDFRRQSAFLTLEQPLGGDAAAVIYFLAPLNEALRAFGERGYRLVNLEAGLAGGRAYLAAYSLGFGASGLTFYDAEVVRFFSPAASGDDAIFVVALGRAARAEERVLLSATMASPSRRS
jgi:SagB-type dehydrogenase family enzyme